MVMPYYLEHLWSRVGAVYASDVCQFRDKEWEKVQVEESVKGGGKLGAHNTILDQSYVQDHVQLYRDVVERVIRPWDSTPDNTVSSLLISPSSLETQVSQYTGLPTLDLLIEGSMDTKPPTP